ncbi:hypothetical protein [Pseudoduganella lutea]|uniref:Uncharacterized protein n=1 Tax=Pseudoduganella lutea TaxID=321985 RepID=A0A4P6L148_9BURK|nr:hypothetical protein [Pseudoduganella lutea]QBE64602.1 hypothetical protein EWM63_17720 [Pseudoduganella lutea]
MTALLTPSIDTRKAGARRFVLGLLLVLLAFVSLAPPDHNGDFVEYTLVAHAIATHGTPDIRLADIDTVKHAIPQWRHVYEFLEKDMVAGKEEVYAAFVRGRGGDVYAVHFFGYPALAAIPYKLFQLTGLPPFRCFLVVNAVMIFVLGMALLRLFGSATRAAAGLALFMLCGGMLYARWSSPECLSAAALLAALAYYGSGAFIRGGLLGGLATLQNPTILFFFGFAPLLRLCIDYQPAIGLAANLRRQVTGRAVAGLALGLALFALPPLFNLYQYGVPNIIVKKFSNSDFVSTTRFVSFFFDLNQGLLIGVPAVAAALLWTVFGKRHARTVPLLALAMLFMLALVVPAMAVLNWNSGAVGIMRYAFWAAMPLLFVLLWQAAQLPRWPRMAVTGIFAVQLVCMVHALSYTYVQFSPLALAALRWLPGQYHPEPEIFAERSANNDDYINPAHVYHWPREGQPVKWLYNTGHPGIEQKLCGTGQALAPANAVTDTYRGWRYVDGALLCRQEGAGVIRLTLPQFQYSQGVQLAQGWSGPEAGGGEWDGVWSNGDASTLSIDLPADKRTSTLTLLGHYFEGNRRTRVAVDGRDAGWVELDKRNTIPLGHIQGTRITVTLRHEAPAQPNGQDTRKLAFFLTGIEVK